MTVYPIKTILDYGAGVGAYAWEAHKLGFDVYAFDIWQSHREYMAQTFPDLKQTKKPITTDLCVMIEVAEHMTDAEVIKLFKKIKPTYLLFSACNTTTEMDEYWGHINIKQPDQWHEFLKQFGYDVVQKMLLPTDHTFLYKMAS